MWSTSPYVIRPSVLLSNCVGLHVLPCPFLPQGLCCGCSLCQDTLFLCISPGRRSLLSGSFIYGRSAFLSFRALLSCLIICAHPFILYRQSQSMRAKTFYSDCCMPSTWLLVGTRQIFVESVNGVIKILSRGTCILCLALKFKKRNPKVGTPRTRSSKPAKRTKLSNQDFSAFERNLFMCM